MARRLMDGIQVRTDTLATALFAGIDFKGDFLRQKVTRQMFTKEQHIPSPIIERGSVREWQQDGRPDAFARARQQVDRLLEEYQPPVLEPAQRNELSTMMTHLAREAGMDKLPELETAI